MTMRGQSTLPTRIALIANPKAGAGRALTELESATDELWGYQLDLLLFEDPVSLQHSLQSLSLETHRAVVILGGDGTLNQCLPALLLKGIPVYVYPVGTANDLAREQGVVPSWKKVQQVLDHPHPKGIDVLQVNGHPFATVAGIGIGSTLTEEFNQLRMNPRGLVATVLSKFSQHFSSDIYTWLAAKTILLGRSPQHRVQISTNSFKETLRTCAIMICNQGELGGDLIVAPKLDQTDGRFNVLIVPRTTRLGILAALLSLKKGHLPSDLIVFSTDDLTVTNLDGQLMQVFGDGETLTASESLHFGLHPSKLQLLIDEAGGAG